MSVDFVSLAVMALVAAISPVLANLVPNKLVPETVILLIAGAVLGPYCLNVVHVTSEISLLSELGMAFLFLLAGYEINPKNIAGKQGGRAVGTWFVSFVAAVGFVMLITGSEADGIASLAAAIALTTTAIGALMPILEERGVLGTRVGDLVLSYGTYGELMPILAISLLLGTRAKWATVAVLLAFFAIAVLVAWRAKSVAKVGNRLYDFLVDRVDSNSQTLVRITVFLLIGLVAVSAVFDLDIILGAFAAGFVLRHVVPDGNRSLEQKLLAIGYGFLIPLFFVVSGAGIDLSAIAAGPLKLVAFIALLMVVRFVPIIVSLAIHKDTRVLPWFDRISVAFYCTTALPLIVAVTNIAVSAGAMNASTASIMVAAGAVSVFLMPLLASVCQRVASAEPIKAIEELKDSPDDASGILKAHVDKGTNVVREESKRVREAIAAYRERRHKDSHEQ